MVQKWELVRSVKGSSYKVFSVRTDTACSPRTRMNHDFYVVESPAWVGVIALTEKNEVIMVRQYRHGVRKVTLELPGGLVDEGFAPVDSARKELLEEVGYQAEEFILLGKAHPQPAMLNNYYYCYLANSAKRTAGQNLEITEDIEVIFMPLKKIPEFIRNGEINHALVITSFYWFFDYIRG